MRVINPGIHSVWIVLFFCCMATGCRPQTRFIQSPPHYNFGEVFTHSLGAKLKEISGIAWDSKRNEFIAHNDELGKLYFLDKDNKAIKSEFAFGPKGDYEDVAIMNGIIYVLRSDGQITRVTRDSSDRLLGTEAGKLPVTGTLDFESMYADNERGALVIICKNCSFDDKKTVSAFAYYPDSSGFDNTPLFTIDAEKVRALSPFKTSKFQPSAAAIHPVLRKLFILSSASNQLAVADLNGNVEAVYKLAKKLFPQPEGLTFRSNGDMYISNEAVSGASTLLRFVYKP